MDEQANYVNAIWTLPQDPREVLAEWRWIGKIVVRSSWVWVHFVHLYFAGIATFSLIVFVVVAYSSIRQERFWIGDAFASIASRLWIRWTVVAITWYIAGFFTLIEFVLYTGNKLLDEREGHILLIDHASGSNDVDALQWTIIL
uniref:Uncharacterized protein n=1 Tax=Globisporangium ultimum (strain ATCC 200006 / CBS 805.95 / DAOM BR144) TaxID=431595 RepID=K3WJ36_GLOUD